MSLYLSIKKSQMGSRSISPKEYRAGFQAAQQELEVFLQINNRLRSIKAIQQLKQGELFAKFIQPDDFTENEF